MARRAATPLLVILGATASGKSSLAVEIAGRLPLEVISADAFAVYRGLVIGTDAPSAEVRAQVPHHLVGVVPPEVRYSAGDFARQAAALIDDIHARGRCPAVVGGSQLYVAALLDGLFLAPRRDPRIRAELEDAWARDPVELRRRLAAVDPEALAATGANDRQRVIRALGHYLQTGQRISDARRGPERRPRLAPLVFFPDREWGHLCDRIETRVTRMFSSGLIEEVDGLLARGVPPDAHALKAIGYRQAVRYLSGAMGLGEAVDDTIKTTRNLARKQLLGLRRQRSWTSRPVPTTAADPAGMVIRQWTEHLGV